MPEHNLRSARGKSAAESSSPSSSNHLIQLLDRKLNEQRTYFVDQIKASEERLIQQLGVISAEIANVRSDFKLLSNKVAALSKNYDALNGDFDKLRAKVNQLESEKVAADLVIFNVANDVDPIVVADKLNTALKCEHIKVKAAELRKSTKRPLRLSDIGLVGESKVGVHECLTPYSRELLASALRYKKSNLLHAVFTLRGNVFVRRTAESSAIKIVDTTALTKVVGNV